MGNNMLIAGLSPTFHKEIIEKLVLKDYLLAILSGEVGEGNSDTADTESVKNIRWNRPSPISSRSCVIQTESFFASKTHSFIDNSLIVFDSSMWNEKYSSPTIDSSTQAADELILSYQYLTLELLSRIEQKKQKSRLIFLLRTLPSLSDVDHSSSLKKSGAVPAPLLVSAAENAFQSFVTNITTYISKSEYVSTLLISASEQNEVMNEAGSFTSWLKEYLDTLDARKDLARSSFWVKVGSKASNGFSIFRK